MKRPAIPQVPATDRVLGAMKERLEQLSGDRGADKIALLPSTATTAQIIAKINEILELLQR